MRTLILTGKFGLGHIKAAEAVKEQLLMQNENQEIDVVDFVEYMFPNTGRYVYGGFNFLVSKCSGLYNALNKFAGKNTTVPLKHTVANKMEHMIAEYNPDQIIVTLPLCSQYISKYKLSTGCKIPMYTFITDITAHEEWIAEGTDHYFVGDVSTKNTLLSKGVAESKITVSGIPVQKKFYQNEVKSIGEKKEILIMGGGLGLFSSGDKILNGLAHRNDANVTVITGKNEKLKTELAGKFPQMEIIGFTNQVEEYMKRADLIMTKAGGITTFEAIASNTPLYVVRPFLEQEYGNAKYIEEHNIGRVFWDNNPATDEWEDFMTLMEHPTLLFDMQKNMMNLKETFDERGILLCS